MILRFAPLVCAALLAGAGAASARPSSTVNTVKVTAKEYRFVLSTSKVPAGRVKFVIKDTGSSQHDFAIAGHTSKTIGPGQSTTMTVTLRKGKYPYRCTVDSHAELGMRACCVSRSAVRDLSRLGSDERHRALAPAFSTGAIARAARPAATAAAPSAVPVGKAGVGSAAVDRPPPSGRSNDRTGRPSVRTMCRHKAGRHAGSGD